MQIATYKEAVNYLESFIGKIRLEITPEFLRRHDPLERMRVLLDLLGNPQNKFPSVLVGGTSGKGSTAYLISHILTIAGYKTGLTISPHLQKVNERLQINGKSISDEKFRDLLTSILSSIEGMQRMDVGAPSYFEILISMAFLYFVKEKVDIAVVEVGMGGEFDATNTLYPLVTVLTNVSLDHTSILGGSVQKIAKTKAGIIKRGKGEGGKGKDRILLHPSSLILYPVVVTGVKQPSVIKIVENRCKKAGGALFRLGKDFGSIIKKESLERSVFDLTTASDRIKQLNDLNLSLLGRHQVENASLAIETVLQLRQFSFKVSEDSIRKALRTAFFPGRFEVVSVIGSPLSVVGNKSIGYQSVSLETDEQKTGKPEAENRKPKTDNRISYTLILDGAHNPAKMRAFLSTLERLYPRNSKIFVISFKGDKNIKGMLKQILSVADQVVITEFHAITDMSKKASAEASNIKYQISHLLPAQRDFGGQTNIKSGAKVMVEKDSKKALDKALSLLTIQQFNSTIIVVTGSLYLVGEIRNML